MKKLFCCFLLLCFGGAGWGQERPSIPALLSQAEPLLQNEIRQSSLPLCVKKIAKKYPLTLSSLPSGIAAEYKPSADKLYFSKKVIRKWIQEQDSFPNAQTLARCLAPVYLHELTHARNHLFAQQHRFFWPTTITDEYLAVFWQTHLIKENLHKEPHFYDDCHIFMPPTDFLNAPKDSLLSVVSAHYLKTDAQLPPPLTKENIHQLQQTNQILWKGFLFQPKRRVLSLKSFWKKGSNWTFLRQKQINLLPHTQFFKIYTQQQNLLQQELQNVNFL